VHNHVVVKTFPERLGWLREQADASARHLSRLAGLSPSMVSKLELGQIENPTRDTLHALAIATGSSLDWLALGRGSGPSRAQIKRAIGEAEARLVDTSTGPEAA